MLDADLTPQRQNGGLLLAIESSCDETGAAVIDRRRKVLSNVVADQTELHQRFWGVVPEIASRAHVRCLLPTIDEALRQAGVGLSDLCAVAVVSRPGLVGSLLVGLTAAKTLSLALDIPLVSVDHIEAHLYACRLAAGRDVFPAVGLVVSGGHSNLYDCRDPLELELVGSTIDDAAGEAFDKVARVLDLSYPGGPAIEQAASGGVSELPLESANRDASGSSHKAPMEPARSGDRKAFDFPRTFLHDDRLDFSFSGLKTAVLYEVRGTPGSSKPVPPLTPRRVADIAASFQEAVVDVLVAKCQGALEQFDRRRLLVGGGVAANRRLRERLREIADEMSIELLVAPLEYCTDNAAMSAIAWESLERGQTASLDLDVSPGLVRKKTR